MRTTTHSFLNLLGGLLLLLAACLAAPAGAQNVRGPLTFQGLHQQEVSSAAARAFGGVTIGRGGDVALMFANPASMRADGLRLSVGGARRYLEAGQEQHFAPVRYYPNLSLLLEGLTDGIPDPDPDLIGFTPADSVQRPFDDLAPAWSHDDRATAPLHVLAALPVDLGGVTLTVGGGFVQYADLGHHYRNHNVLTPEVLAQRPLPTLRPTGDTPLTVDWYRARLEREGVINGYGGALAAHVERLGLTLGVGGLVLDGRTDDIEERVRRGRLVFFSNEFRADSSVGYLTRTGTSTFSAAEFTLSGTLSGSFVSLGVVARPPAVFDRSVEMTTAGDTSGVAFSTTTQAEDAFRLPWRGAVSLLLTPRERLAVGLEYELRPYASAVYTGADGAESNPWASSALFRVGARYDLLPWLTVRGGIRGDATVFVPDGSPLVDDPVTYRVYATGLGFRFGGVAWNVAYEYADLRYEDVWGGALSRNWNTRHTITADVSIGLPFSL